MSWYVITCRMSGDDEDSCYSVEAQSWQEARDRVERDMRAQLGERMPEADEIVDGDSDITEFYLNHVAHCGDHKPELVYGGGSDMPASTGGGELPAPSPLAAGKGGAA